MAGGTHYWACSQCDSGGHPLTWRQAQDGAGAHNEGEGHLTITGPLEKS